MSRSSPAGNGIPDSGNSMIGLRVRKIRGVFGKRQMCGVQGRDGCRPGGAVHFLPRGSDLGEAARGLGRFGERPKPQAEFCVLLSMAL